jgi:hypothetical protein
MRRHDAMVAPKMNHVVIKPRKTQTNPGVWDETSAIRRLTGENVYAKDMVDHRQL